MGDESLNESELSDGQSEGKRRFHLGERYEILKTIKLEHHNVDKGMVLTVSYVDSSGDACFDHKSWPFYEDWIYSDNYDKMKLVDDYESSTEPTESQVSTEPNARLSELPQESVLEGLTLEARVPLPRLMISKGQRMIVDECPSSDSAGDILIKIEGQDNVQWLFKEEFDNVFAMLA